MEIHLIQDRPLSHPIEFVERKGKGHPDTLADTLAEHLSAQYAQYTLDHFGVVLHHNFDKVGLLGGASEVGFGYGRLTKPIRVLLNGRASTCFGETAIDVRALLIEWATEFLCRALPLAHPKEELEFHDLLSTQSSPGKTEEVTNREGSARKYWFQPRGAWDVPERERLFSNDTSLGVGFAPASPLETVVLAIEKRLNGASFAAEHPWIGSDIKIMGFRRGDAFEITMCVPQIGAHVPSARDYQHNVDVARKEIEGIIRANDISTFQVHINTRDNYATSELYLTAIGSSIESGDEGLVGRGNRIQGVIAPMRPMSMEGAAGKNPVYHIGKLYYLAAQRISDSIYAECALPNEVYLVSQSGRDLLDPWIVAVRIPTGSTEPPALRGIVEREVRSIPAITDDLIAQRISIC